MIWGIEEENKIVLHGECIHYPSVASNFLNRVTDNLQYRFICHFHRPTLSLFLFSAFVCEYQKKDKNHADKENVLKF